MAMYTEMNDSLRLCAQRGHRGVLSVQLSANHSQRRAGLGVATAGFAVSTLNGVVL